jgi:exonuclease-1
VNTFCHKLHIYFEYQAHLSDYDGCTAAIDAYAWLHRGAQACAMELCQGKPTEKFVAFCLKRLELLQKHGIKPLMVFDGTSISAKISENADRKQQRAASLEKAVAAHAKGDSVTARSFFARAVSVTHEMAHQLIVALRARDLPLLVAPFEADAELAFLSRHGLADLIITEDSDALVFGCKRVLYKLDDDGNGLEIQLRNLGACSDLSFVNWSHDMFLDMCLLAGCDYVPSVHGIGIKTAHRLVKEHRTPKRILEALRSQSSKFLLPDDFEQAFWQGRAVFRHARVYDPRTCADTHLTPLSETTLARFERTDIGLNFLGPPLPPQVAHAVAIGRVHPKTYVPWPATALPRASTAKQMQPQVAEGLRGSTPGLVSATLDADESNNQRGVGGDIFVEVHRMPPTQFVNEDYVEDEVEEDDDDLVEVNRYASAAQMQGSSGLGGHTAALPTSGAFVSKLVSNSVEVLHSRSRRHEPSADFADSAAAHQHYDYSNDEPLNEIGGGARQRLYSNEETNHHVGWRNEACVYEQENVPGSFLGNSNTLPYQSPLRKRVSDTTSEDTVRKWHVRGHVGGESNEPISTFPQYGRASKWVPTSYGLSSSPASSTGPFVASPPGPSFGTPFFSSTNYEDFSSGSGGWLGGIAAHGPNEPDRPADRLRPFVPHNAAPPPQPMRTLPAYFLTGARPTARSLPRDRDALPPWSGAPASTSNIPQPEGCPPVVDYADWGLEGDSDPLSGNTDQGPTPFKFNATHSFVPKYARGNGESREPPSTTYEPPGASLPWERPASTNLNTSPEDLVSQGLACRPFF